ncbi:MAG TPA: Hpt domain-containing protein [Candidatus Thermoplasmatota archaeon]|nr:Hpt domain-containing protein [Candidatus Thermoplasmatota archaeon]
MSEDDIRNDPEVRRVFLKEARGRLDEMEAILAAGDLPALDSPEYLALRRHAHTLKGLGGSLGYPDLERHAHAVLERLHEAERSRFRTDEGDRELLNGFHALRQDVHAIVKGGKPPAPAAAPEGPSQPPADRPQ